jgi:hypothetical protein
LGYCLRGQTETHTQDIRHHIDEQTELHTQTKPGLRKPDRGSNRPEPFTHMCTHTYSSSPFTTSTQRDSVREVAEADLGQKGKTR